LGSRIHTIRFFVSPEEYEAIRKQMEEAGMDNMAMFARRMLTEGKIEKTDFSVLREINYNMGELIRDMQQIAGRANETGTVTASELNKLQKEYIPKFNRLIQSAGEQNGVHTNPPDQKHA